MVNLRRAARILGLVSYVVAAAELVPLLWCFVPLDLVSMRAFGIGSATSALFGLALRYLGDEDGELYRRDGVLIVVGAWIFASVFGALPYIASGSIPGFVDALFESASGFTTTGASILQDIESVPTPILFWRSLTQWLGGIGIVVLFVALLSELGPGARFLFKLEVPGPKAEIMHARVKQTALALFRVYAALTIAQTLVMLVCGASLYDSLVHTFSTVSTGGFSSHTASAGYFSVPLQLVILVFMAASGVNFVLYYALSKQRDLSILRDVELRVYLGIIFVSSALAASELLASGSYESVGNAILASTFQIVSLLTTTGFATTDFAQWSGLPHALILGLMFIGGCAGSTAGGAKIIRLILGWKVAMREVRLTFSPNSVIAVAVQDQAVPEESLRGVTALLLLWFLGWGFGTVVLSVGDVDIVSAATAALATLSNIGPGLASVGPTENFAFFADWQKLVMILLMWLGRLEFFAVLALVQPSFWRR